MSRRRSAYERGAAGSGRSPLEQPARSTAGENAITRRWSTGRRVLKALGPGLVSGASDDDPSGIGTHATVGASLGYSSLWMTVVVFPMMVVVQYVCAKVGLVSGMGLAGVLKCHYPKKLLYPAVAGLVVANTVNAGVDIGAMAASINLLVPIPIVLLIVPVAMVVLAFLVWGSYRLIARTFKWLTLSLFAYIFASFFARPDLGEVLRGTLIPTVRFDTVLLAALVAILGTNISPYLFFWQASQEVEEEVSMGRKRLSQRRGATDAELKIAAWDVNLGMFFANIVVYFINLTTAATLFVAGKTDITSAADAAQALRPLAGDGAFALFALGMIGSGFLAVPVLTGASAYAVSEAFGWKAGLDEKPRRAKQFYTVITASVVVGMLVNFVGINPIDALFWTAALNGILAPPLLVLVMLVANNRLVMGERVNGPLTNVVGWATVAVMSGAAIGLLLTLAR